MFVFSHTFPVLWEFTFPVLWELYGFLLHPKCSRNPKTWNVFVFPYVSLTMTIQFSHAFRIVWVSIWREIEGCGICKNFKFLGFFNISGEAVIHIIPKIWEKRISIVQEKHRKTQKFHVYGFLKYFGWSKNPYNCRNMRKVNLHNKGKVWGNTNIWKLRVS